MEIRSFGNGSWGESVGVEQGAGGAREDDNDSLLNKQ